ncbi:hypothetical protein [Amycolatopsis sp. H20-H5]|uniref:hypothetical protein n=1 Tax=Amycolatopsis sp. H20-H5 TaxID=3046309 RepID=UPI002DBCB8B4|nr:hypothetical protein [Amycolatopsis sp. H20-H5]MEC3980720.1 hypothetical protein [Amycolatopsis sp. H20-H5]
MATVNPAQSVSDPSSPDYDKHSPLYDVTADSSSAYYVGPLVGDAQSGDEIRSGAAAQVDHEIASGWLGSVVDPMTKDSHVQWLYQQRLDQAKQGLDQGLTIRDSGGAPHTLWANASHEQMNAAISQNANSATVAESSEEWVRLGNELATHQKNLASAISASSGDWQGGGGDAAREHLAKVGQWLGSTAKGATLTGRQQQIHSQTLNETQKQMAANPPVRFSVQDANARLQQITDPVQYAAQASQDMQTYRAQQAARDHAAGIMSQFDDTIGSAIATPAFPPPPKLPGSPSGGASGGGAGGDGGAPAGSADAASARQQPLPDGSPAVPGGDGPGGSKAVAFETGDGPGGGSGSGGHGSGGSGSGGANMPPLTMPGGSGGGSPSGFGSPGLPQHDESTKSAGYVPAAATANPPGFTVPDLPQGGSTTGGQARPGFTPPSFTPPPFTPATGGSGSSLGGGIGRGGGINGDSISSRLSGGSGSGSAGGLGGLRGGGLGAGGSGAGGTGGFRTGGVASGGLPPGAGAGAAAEAEALAARNGVAGAAGKGGAAGSPMGGGMGGGRGGKKEDDAEHRLADYLESDDPDLFSAEEAIAPPVIGDWKNKDWK